MNERIAIYVKNGERMVPISPEDVVKVVDRYSVEEISCFFEKLATIVQMKDDELLVSASSGGVTNFRLRKYFKKEIKDFQRKVKGKWDFPVRCLCYAFSIQDNPHLFPDTLWAIYSDIQRDKTFSEEAITQEYVIQKNGWLDKDDMNGQISHAYRGWDRSRFLTEYGIPYGTAAGFVAMCRFFYTLLKEVSE